MNVRKIDNCFHADIGDSGWFCVFRLATRGHSHKLNIAQQYRTVWYTRIIIKQLKRELKHVPKLYFLWTIQKIFWCKIITKTYGCVSTDMCGSKVNAQNWGWFKVVVNIDVAENILKKLIINIGISKYYKKYLCISVRVELKSKPTMASFRLKAYEFGIFTIISAIMLDDKKKDNSWVECLEVYYCSKSNLTLWRYICQRSVHLP